MSRIPEFPFPYIGYDMTPDGSGIPWYVIQAKMPGPNTPKCAIVYHEPTAGHVEEVKRYPDIYGEPQFYIRPMGRRL